MPPPPLASPFFCIWTTAPIDHAPAMPHSLGMSHHTPYGFRPAALSDLPRLKAWHATSHVRKWWDTAPKFGPKDLSCPKVRRWIVTFHDQPFAYLQDYSVHAEPNHHFAHLPKGARGVDQFIGDPTMIGQGHGPALLRQHIASLFSFETPVVATDPHPENFVAVKAYAKAGFDIAGPPIDTQWGLVLPMIAVNPDQARVSFGDPITT